MKLTKNWFYDIECTNPTDYEARIYCGIDNSLFRNIFEKAILKLKRQGQIKGKARDISEVDLIEAEARYLNYLFTGVRSWVKKIIQDVAKDGITVLDYHVVRAYYTRHGDLWKFNLIFTGTYADKR